MFTEVMETLTWAWSTLWAMPWWFHVIFTGPLGLFIVIRMVNLLVGLVRDLTPISKPKEEGPEVDAGALIAVMTSIVVGAALVPSVVDTLEEVEEVPNQLIQKKGRPEIGVVDPVRATTIAISEQKLRQGFEKIGFERGTKALTRLESEFKGLRAMLGNSRIDETVLNLKRVAKLTDGLYQQGLSFLSQILNVAEQSDASSKEDLLEEGTEIRAALEKCKPESNLFNMLSDRLTKNVEAYNKVKGFSEKLDELFCQVGMCRDSIREIRLGIPELLDNKPKEEYDRTLLELKTRVEMAQRVQAEYTKQGI